MVYVWNHNQDKMYFVLSFIFQSRGFWRNLHRWQKFYTAAGIDKSHLCKTDIWGFGILSTGGGPK